MKGKRSPVTTSLCKSSVCLSNVAGKSYQEIEPADEVRSTTEVSIPSHQHPSSPTAITSKSHQKRRKKKEERRKKKETILNQSNDLIPKTVHGKLVFQEKFIYDFYVL